MNVSKIANWIGGEEALPQSGRWLEKFNPHDGSLLSRVADSSADDATAAIGVAADAGGAWAQTPAVRRGQILSNVAAEMARNAADLANCIAVETGKPPQDAAGEVSGAILQAEYFAGEGMRLYGRSLTSAVVGKSAYTIRHPIGVAGLIVPANTPIANIAWKVFPALVCGNAVVLKAAEDAPDIALRFARITKAAGLPDGLVNVVQGLGANAGAAIVEDERIGVVSFTGSTAVGRRIARVCAERLARVSLELGGKNPFVVCDDADIDLAVHWASLSAFSNAGQRCAAASRILVFESIYDAFRDKLAQKASALKLGTADGCDLGPVISRHQRDFILAALETASKDGGRIVCGGGAPDDPALRAGFYVEPTLIEGLAPTSAAARTELFGPVGTLHVVKDMLDALAQANDTEYGLTAAIHTRDIDRAMWFAQRVRAGVANVNLGTFGSEPHMPFGGFGLSGNGSREPGVEALDVYSELKNIQVLTRQELIV